MGLNAGIQKKQSMLTRNNDVRTVAKEIEEKYNAILEQDNIYAMQ